MTIGSTRSAPNGAAAIAALGSGADELGQVLELLRLGGDETPGRLRVAVGDRRLLELHRELTGRDVEVVAECGGCGEVNVAALSADVLPAPCERVAWLGGGGLREPTYDDLHGLPPDEEAAEAELLRRCTVGEPARAAVADDLERIDDSLTGPILLACVECGTGLEVAVDVERAVLERLQRHAAEVEVEVHLLARAYGWSLAAIERLPDERRRRLAGLVADGR